MTDFEMDVHIRIPATQYKALYMKSQTTGSTVAVLVAEIVCGEFIPRNFTPERQTQLRELWQLRYSDQDIAARMQVGSTTVSRWRKALGLPTQRKRIS